MSSRCAHAGAAAAIKAVTATIDLKSM